MFKTMTNSIYRISHSQWYWLLYITGSIISLAAALYYQYILEELPCVVCIQIRLWFSLFIIVAFAGLLTRNHRVMHFIANLSTVLIAIALTERSYLLLGTERGFVFADCGFNVGLPAWFAIEEWLPWIYRVETSCGYTPEIVFGITMAEALMVLSSCLLLVSVCVLLASFITDFYYRASDNQR